MKIAQVAPLYESVPSKYYGGTERVVSWLTEELVRRGHDVTLFASGDSKSMARLIPGCATALRTNPTCKDSLAHHIVMLEKVLRRASDFDVIHFHIDYLHFPVSRRIKTPHVSTLHGRLDIPDLVPVFREFNDVPIVSISMVQRQPLPFANWIGNVYHGLPGDLLRFHPQPGKYLAFLGRISPEKRPDRAIEIARRAGIPLKIAAKVDAADREYFESKIKPLLVGPSVEFVGEIGDKEKSEFLGNAFANLFPIDWPEPFGINMIEAMACGTPTIAFRHGSVSEVIEDGLTGFIVDNVEDAVQMLSRVPQICRKRCRSMFEQRFTAPRMTSDYLSIYETLISGTKSLLEETIETPLEQQALTDSQLTS